MEAEELQRFNFVDLIDLCFKLNSMAHSYWQFYAAINTVILGWLLTAKIDLSFWQKSVITLGVVVMLMLSVASLHKIYKYLFAVLDEVKAAAGTVAVRSGSFREALVSIVPMPYWVVYTVHIGVAIAVLVILWGLI